MTLLNVAAVFLFSSYAFASPIGDTYGFNSSSLTWTPCDLDFPASQQLIIDAHGAPLFCATLKVPLDYTNSKSTVTLDLQLIKVEATKQPVKGSIIMNPGGPGASGVKEISEKGTMYREVFGGQWNVIGFDARGTGRTMPFACNLVNKTALSLSRRAANFTVPQNDIYAVLKSKAWSDAGLFVKACAETEGNKAIASYIGTPFVARDLLKIVDALGEDGLLRFWGRSYSTILGQTFAAMFPDRVGRILLDSTLRLDDYYSGQWQTANRDTEYSMLHFFQECVNAGPEICPMANFTGARTTAQSLLQELADVFQELLDNPIIMPPSYVNAATPWWQPGNTLYQELKYMIFTFVYYPSSFPILTYYIDLAFKRDWQTVLNPPAPAPPSNSTAAPEIPWHLGINAFHGIACADAAFRAKKPEDMYSLVRSQGASGSWADVFAPQTWPCAQWRFKAAEHFEGPFLGINTSYPILVANSPFDPITPLSGAWEASANLLGSRLLVHKGHGHGVMNHQSNCTVKVIHDYFNDGKLPEPGTECEPDKSAFEVALEGLPGGGDL